MKFLIEQWNNPATRYGYLSAIATFSLYSSVSTLPWLAVLGASIGVGLVLSVSIQIVRYFKSIADEAKHTLIELQDTLKEAQEAVEKVSREFEDAPKGQNPTIMQSVKKVVSKVTKEFDDAKEGQTPTIMQNVRTVVAKVTREMDEAQEGQEPTIMQNVKGTVAEVKDAMTKVNKELGEANEGEKPTLSQTVKKTLGEVNETVDQGRSGWAGWFLNLNKKAPQKTPTQEATAKATPQKAVTEKSRQKAKSAMNKSSKPSDKADKALVNSLLANFDAPENKTAQALYEQGVVALRSKNFSQALTDFQAVESSHPKSNEADLAKLQMIKCYFSLQQNARALSIAERFIQAKPKHEDVDYAYYMRAMIHFDAYQKAKDKKPELAKKALEAFKILSKKFPKSEYTLGSKDEIAELESRIKAKTAKEPVAKANLPVNAPKQSWSAWAKSFVPSFALFSTNKAETPKAPQPANAVRKSTRLAAQKI